MLKVLIPAASIAAIVILAAVIAGISDGSVRKMSDGSDGSTTDPGLVFANNGLKYRDLKEGAGQACPKDATVKVNYTGWLSDGTVFDSSKQPTELSLKNTIRGWQDGIPGMKPGGIRKLVIAPDQGYGSTPQKGIPPGSTLIFEVELVSVTQAPDYSKLSDGTAPGADDPNLKEIVYGVKYRDIKEGSGEPCPRDATVKVHYTGWLLNGEMFDSSRKQGHAATFPLKGVVKGWQEGIPGMKPGGIRKLVISPDMAYGSSARPGIPANSTLVFEVEMVQAAN
jgi:peptidylprolyl isomerase